MNLNNKKIIVAIENAVIEQVEASGFTGELHRLDGEKIVDVILQQIEGFVLVKKRNLIGNPNVDFLQAPRWAKYWLMDGNSKEYWWSSVRPIKDMDLLCYVWGGQHIVEEAPSFGFTGPWNESLTSKKAMIEAQEQKG